MRMEEGNEEVKGKKWEGKGILNLTLNPEP